MSTPEEFATEYLDALDRDEQPQLAKRIEARDAAIELAAKRTLLKEIMNEGKRRYLVSGGGSVGHTYDVLVEVLAKYETQAAEGPGAA